MRIYYRDICKKLSDENEELKEIIKKNEQRFEEAKKDGVKREAPGWELRFMCDLFLNNRVKEFKKCMQMPWLAMDEKKRHEFYEVLVNFLDFLKEHGYSIHTSNL